MKYCQIRKLLDGKHEFYMSPINLDTYLRRKHKYNGRLYDSKEMWLFILDNELDEEIKYFGEFYFKVIPHDVNSFSNLEVENIEINDNKFRIYLGYESNK